MTALSKIVINISGTAIVKKTKQKINLIQGTRNGEYYLDSNGRIWGWKELKYIKCKFV